MLGLPRGYQERFISKHGQKIEEKKRKKPTKTKQNQETEKSPSPFHHGLIKPCAGREARHENRNSSQEQEEENYSFG